MKIESEYVDLFIPSELPIGKKLHLLITLPPCLEKLETQ